MAEATRGREASPAHLLRRAGHQAAERDAHTPAAKLGHSAGVTPSGVVSRLTSVYSFSARMSTLAKP